VFLGVFGVFLGVFGVENGVFGVFLGVFGVENGVFGVLLGVFEVKMVFSRGFGLKKWCFWGKKNGVLGCFKVKNGIFEGF
jgi:hypothetical protein